MTQAFIEHVNLNVSDPQRTATIVSALFDWHIRWQGAAMDVPFNHIGLCVDDLDAVEARARALGLTPFGHDDYEPGKRFYFFDPDDIEFEIVSYTTTRKKNP